MLGITQKADGTFKFVIGEGESKRADSADGQHEYARLFCADDKGIYQKWVMEGPTHHYALGIGHYADTVKKKVGDALGIESVIVR